MDFENEVKLNIDDDAIFLPPWIAFPEIDQLDMFWRMGRGEEYIDLFCNYFEKLSDKKAYEIKFPAPNEWKEFYE